MEKNLEKLFAELEGTFDIEMPETGHAARFLEKLEAPKNQLGVSKGKYPRNKSNGR